MKTGFGLKILKKFHFASDGSRWELGFYARLKKSFPLTFFAAKQAVWQKEIFEFYTFVILHSITRAFMVISPMVETVERTLLNQ